MTPEEMQIYIESLVSTVECMQMILIKAFPYLRTDINNLHDFWEADVAAAIKEQKK